MRVLIAPNAFKNSLDATAAAAAIEEGLLSSGLDCSCDCFPVGDGGDGTAALLVQHFKGVQVPVTVSDPLNRKMTASFGLIDHGATAIIEMADAAGLRLLQPGELNPLAATSFGTGEMIRAALDKKVKKIIIGMGGSATVDGGCGILHALGLHFLDREGAELKNLPADLVELERIGTRNLDSRIHACEMVVLCDVDNKLLGEKGAAKVFGPQKGATPAAVQHLDAALSRFAAIALLATGKDIAAVPRGGTAGGAAAGLYGFIDAKLVNGIDYFLDLSSFDKALAKADMLITGEGSIDEQTLNGKAPYGVARRAKQKNIPVIGLAGSVSAAPGSPLFNIFDRLMSINNEEPDLKTAMLHTRQNLVRTAMALGKMLA